MHVINENRRVCTMGHNQLYNYLNNSKVTDDILPKNTAYITILSSDPIFGNTEPFFKKEHDNTLNVVFDDSYQTERILTGGTVRVIDQKTASEIAKFILKNLDKLFIVACDYTKIRSSSVAKMIYKVLEKEDEFYRLYGDIVINDLVYNSISVMIDFLKNEKKLKDERL